MDDSRRKPGVGVDWRSEQPGPQEASARRLAAATCRDRARCEVLTAIIARAGPAYHQRSTAGGLLFALSIARRK
jgi:hypothetical protein